MKYIIITTLAFILCFSVSTAQNAAINGFYASINAAYQTTEGDLNGNIILYTDQEVFLVPDIAGGWGYGLGLGTRGPKNAFEIHYNRTEHEADFLDSKGEAVMRVFSMDYKHFFRSESKFQPYFQLGWCPAFTLKIKDGSANISPAPEVRDSRLYGSIGAWQLGGGISYVLFSRMNINGGITYRFTKYTGVSGGKDIVSARIVEPLQGSGVNAFFNLCYFITTGSK